MMRFCVVMFDVSVICLGNHLSAKKALNFSI
jgi:hypothetical protein